MAAQVSRRALLVGAAVLASGYAGWSGLYGTPPSLDDCIERAVAADVDSGQVSRTLSLLGQRVEKAPAASAAVAQSDFKRCLWLEGRWSSLSKPVPLTAKQLANLELSPSFQYGRYFAQLAAQAPELNEAQRDATARLLAQAGPVAEAMRQAHACPDTPEPVADSLRKYGPAYVAATGAALGMWTGAEAMPGARDLLLALGAEVTVPACSSRRAEMQALLLNEFSVGGVEGLPCVVVDIAGESELRCGDTAKN